jgi:mono/diheme cytochrome c family protein
MLAIRHRGSLLSLETGSESSANFQALGGDKGMARKRYKKVQALYGAVTAVVFFLPVSAGAEEPGDPRAGLAFARANCAGCHAVRAADDTSPNFDAPPFESVAKTPGMTGRALAVWLQTSHPTMPNFLVSEKDRDNVIAYIMSLQPLPAQ